MTDDAPASLRSRQRDERRARMVSAALTLFDRHGFEAVSVQRIAASVDLSDRTVFRYFPVKEDLVLAHALDANRAFLERAGRRIRDGLGGRPLLGVLVEVLEEVLAEVTGRVDDDALRVAETLTATVDSVRARALFHEAEMTAELAGLVPPTATDVDHLTAAVFVAVAADARRRRRASADVDLASAFRATLADLPRAVRR